MIGRRLAFTTLIIMLLVPTLAAANDDCLAAPCAAAGVSPDIIAEYPQPNVRPMTPNDELLYDRAYRKVTTAVEIFDAPGGSPIATLDPGFNFITPVSTESEWTQINFGEWVRTEALIDATASRFAGVRLPTEPLPYPFGWLLVHTRPSRTPGAEALAEDWLYYRYTLVNLYSSVEVDGWRWYQIGADEWVIQTQIAKFLPVTRPAEVDTERWVSVDLYEQVAIAYEGETPVYATLVSSGMADWPTNEGLFHVYIRYPRTLMSGAEGQPDFYYLEEVPWTMYFDGDIALHGAYWHDGFGYRRSHGCVNMSITDAAWLYEWANPEFDFSVDNDMGPAVYVYSSGDYR